MASTHSASLKFLVRRARSRTRRSSRRVRRPSVRTRSTGSHVIFRSLAGSVTLGYGKLAPTITVSICTVLTLLLIASPNTQCRITSIRSICTSIELLIAAPLQRSSNIHECVAFDGEGALGIARVLDRSGCDAAEGAGEGLKIGSGGDSAGGRKEDGEESGEDDGSLHFDVCW
jgi:hypothetical protein